MFEVIRYRNRGELSYHFIIIPHGSDLPSDNKTVFTIEIKRFGPFATEEEAGVFIEEVEKDTY